MKVTIKNLDDWVPVETGQVIKMPSRGVRKVVVSVNTTTRAAVFVAKSEDMADAKLVGAGEGAFQLAYTAKGDTYVDLRTTGDGVSFIRGHAPSHQVAASDGPSFVVLAPRGRPSELDRLMYTMKLNERARQAKLDAEIAAMRRAVEGAKAAAVPPAPARAPQPADPATEEEVPGEGQAEV